MSREPTDTTNALRACPFCGGAAGFVKVPDADGNTLDAVGCHDCGGCGPTHIPLMDDARPAAAASWNRRAALATAQPSMDANQRCDYGAVAERARSREEARVEVLGRDEVTTSERPMKFKDFLGGALYGWCGEYRRGWNDALDAEREWSSQTSPPTPHGEAVLKAAHAIRLAQGAALAIGAS